MEADVEYRETARVDVVVVNDVNVGPLGSEVSSVRFGNDRGLELRFDVLRQISS